MGSDRNGARLPACLQFPGRLHALWQPKWQNDSEVYRKPIYFNKCVTTIWPLHGINQHFF